MIINLRLAASVNPCFRGLGNIVARFYRLDHASSRIVKALTRDEEVRAVVRNLKLSNRYIGLTLMTYDLVNKMLDNLKDYA